LKTHFLLLLLTFSLQGNTEEYVINVTEIIAHSSHKEQLEVLLSDIYYPLAITPFFVYYPSLRGLDLVNKGSIDAEALRLEEVATQYQNLLKIPEPIARVISGFFCRSKAHCQINARSVIAMHSGFQSGASFCRDKKLTCKYESKPNNLLQMFDKGLVSSLLMSTIGASKILCLSKQQTIYYQLEPDFERDAFHYVHKKYAHLQSALSEAIIEMKLSKRYLLFTQTWTEKLKSCGKTLIPVEV